MSHGRRVASWLALGLSILGAPCIGGCSTFLDFDHFAEGDGGAGTGDGGPDDGGVPVDAPGTDAPGQDAWSPTTHTLSVTVTGMGTVTSDPTGIDCGTTCSADFTDGATVTLTAAPDTTSSFTGWTGACTGTSPTCMVTLTAAASTTATFAVRGSVDWVRQITFPGQDSFTNDVVVAPDGNVIVGTVVDDGGGADLYVTKLDRDTGDTIWETLIDTPTGEYYGGLAVGSDGDVYACATISGFGTTYSLAGTAFTGDLGGNIAVYGLNGSSGAVRWAVQWGGDGQDRPTGMAVSGSSVYVIGETSSSNANFGGLPLSASIGTRFVVRASTMTGGVSALTGFAGNFQLFGVAANATNVAVTGSYTADATVGGCGFHRSGTGSDMLIASLSATDLSCQWSRTAGDSTSGNSTEGFSIAALPDGGWAVTGYMQGAVLFATSGTSLASHGMSDVFAVRYGPTGDHVWSFRYGGTGQDVGTSIATMATGETFLTGTFTSSITFGAITLSGPSDVFVTRMSAGATPMHDWAVALGGDSPDRTEGLAVDDAGNVYAAAYFSGMTNVGGTALTGADYDTWVARLVP